MPAGCQQLPGEVEPGCLSKLMRGGAEDSLELPDEMKGRDPNVARKIVDRERSLPRVVEQQIAGATQSAEPFVSEQHSRRVYSRRTRSRSHGGHARLSSRAMNASRWAVFFIVATIAVVQAQIPVTKEPHHHVVFENAQFRIMDVNVPAGETTLDHSHDRDIVTVAMSNAAEVRTQAAGEAWANRPRRPVGDIETTDYAGKGSTTHKFETMGATAYQLFAVENLKANGWSATPAVSGAGTTLAKESRSFRVYTVALGKDRQQTSHAHAVPTIVVLLGGKVMSEGPDEKAKANAPAPVGLKQIDRPGQWVLVPAGDTHHLVRLGNDESQIVEIEVR